MAETVLVLGANGQFGAAAAEAFEVAGWQVRRFRRGADSLGGAAQGAALIVNGWNPGYARWAEELPQQTRQIIAAARSAGAAVLQPCNVYVYGPGAPEVLGVRTPHRAANPLGKLRVDMERTMRDSVVQVILLRAGDFIDSRPSGGWLNRVIAKPLARGRIAYPGPLDRPHAWAYLPDLAHVAVALAGLRHALPRVTEAPFAGYTLTGAELAQGLTEATGRPVRATRMSWLPLGAARPFWPMARHLLEMRYLWEMPHRLDPEPLAGLFPDLPATPLATALRASLGLGPG